MYCKFRFLLYLCIRSKYVIITNSIANPCKYKRITSQSRHSAVGAADRYNGLPAYAQDASDGGGGFRGFGAGHSDVVEDHCVQYAESVRVAGGGGAYRDRPEGLAFRRGYERARTFLLHEMRCAPRCVFRLAAGAAASGRRTCGGVCTNIL